MNVKTGYKYWCVRDSDENWKNKSEVCVPWLGVAKKNQNVTTLEEIDGNKTVVIKQLTDCCVSPIIFETFAEAINAWQDLQQEELSEIEKEVSRRRKSMPFDYERIRSSAYGALIAKACNGLSIGHPGICEKLTEEHVKSKGHFWIPKYGLAYPQFKNGCLWIYDVCLVHIDTTWLYDRLIEKLTSGE